MSCQCSNRTDIRGRCHPFEDRESISCPMLYDSIFWYFENDSSYFSNYQRITVLEEYFSKIEAIDIFAKFIREKTIEELANNNIIELNVAQELFTFNHAYE